MSIQDLQNWLAILGVGGTVGTLVALIAKAALEGKGAAARHHWEEQREERERRQETDRATYNQRVTVLVREPLAEFVRSGVWPADEEDLRSLLLSLDRGIYEHFLDPEVNRAWVALVAKSVELATRRLPKELDERDLHEFNRIRTEWEDACKRSFGPLPTAPEPTPRREPRDTERTGT